MGLKSQVEFVVVLGILFVVIVAVFYAYQAGVLIPSPVPMGIAEQQKSIKDSVTHIIRMGTDKTIRTLELHGGYLTPPLSSTRFKGNDIAYWQQCHNKYIPDLNLDIKPRLERGIENYIKDNKNILIKSWAGKNISMGDPSVSAQILNKEIIITVNLPTTVNGYPIQQPYTVSVPTQFGEIYNFARDFVEEAASQRFLETFTITSLYYSRYLPTIGALTHCGEFIYKTPHEIEQRMKDIIIYTLTHILWWQPVPTNPSEPRVYPISSVNGKQYQNLDIGVFLPDGFGVTINNPVSVFNNRFLSTQFPFIVPACITTYNIKYSVAYPVIISINDKLTGYNFNFATLVYVNGGEDGMKPGDCDSISGFAPVLCENLNCSARLVVKDGDDNPITGAKAFFGGCLIDESDNGLIEGPILCEENELMIFYNESYEFYSKNVSSVNINNTYILHKIPNVTIHLYKVDIIKKGYDLNGFLASCHACSSSCNYITNFYDTTCNINSVNEYAFISFLSTTTNKEFPIINVDPESVSEQCATATQAEIQADPSICIGNVLENITVNYIPRGSYIVNADLRDPSSLKITGSFKQSYTFGMDRDLYIYIPTLETPVYDISDSQKSCLVSALNECGINPIGTI